MSLLTKLEIEPKVALEPTHSGALRRILLKGELSPQTRYRLTAPKDLCAEDGACLIAPVEFSWKKAGDW